MKLIKLFSLVTVAICSLCSVTAQAQKWPSQPITLVVGYSAGGPVDTTSRIFAKYLAEATGSTVVVENKPGAAGILAANYTTRAKPDGYTLYFAASPSLTISPHVLKSIQFNPLKDLSYLSMIVEYANVLVAGPQTNVKSVNELVALAKSDPNKVSYGSAGIGSSLHLSAVLLTDITKTEMKHVPFKGSSPAMLDVIGGRLTFMFDNIITAQSHIKAGTVRALAVTSAKRNPALPNVPTVQESGGALKDFEVSAWYALVGPPGMPAELQNSIRQAVAKINQNPSFIKQMESGGNTIAKTDGDHLVKSLNKEYTLWGNIIKKLDQKPQ